MKRVLSRRIMPDTPPVEEKDYLCVEFPSGGTLTWSYGYGFPSTMEYMSLSKDGRNWVEDHSIHVGNNGKVYIKGKGEPDSYSPNHLKFSVKPDITTTENYAILSGNIMSVYYGDDFEDAYILKDYAFYNAFSGSDCFIKDISNLKLPATTLGRWTYNQMFGGSTIASDLKTFTKVTALPATNLADGCYQSMFQGISALVEMPELPATTLAPSCYAGMFSGCSIKEVKVLPATTLAKNCYAGMFSNQRTAVHIPHNALPATTLAEACYYTMFQGCTKIQSIPSDLLPAKILAVNCYKQMFRGCGALTYIPDRLLPATTLAETCYANMFEGCTSITRVPRHLLPATTLVSNCYESMFSGCTALEDIPCDFLPATTLAKECYYQMFKTCRGLHHLKSGLLPAATTAEKSYSNMFAACTNLEDLPAGLILATTFGSNTCLRMFDGCIRIESLDYPLIAKDAHLGEYALYYMFNECTGLEETIKDLLPTENLGSRCYCSMFNLCRKLKNTIKFGNSTASYCYQMMYFGCIALTDAEDLPATTLAAGCYESMFTSCTALTKAPKINGTDFSAGPCTSMFNECTSLWDVPKITINGDFVGYRAFYQTFRNCRSLQDISSFEFNCTKVNDQAYMQMFEGCSSLRELPENFTLYADMYRNGSGAGCCQSMFSGCTSITTIPNLPGLSLYTAAYKNMFYGCTGLTTLKGNTPQEDKYLPATGPANSCYEGMFEECTNLKTVPDNFIRASGFSTMKCCMAMFKGCKSLEVAPYLNPTVNAIAGNQAFDEMFANCYSEVTENGVTTYTGLTRMAYLPNESIAKLPFTRATQSAFASMFSGCKLMTEIPIIDVEYLVGTGVFSYMYYGCTALETIPSGMFAKVLKKTDVNTDVSNFATSMFEGCTSLDSTKIPSDLISAQTLEDGGYQSMFKGCESLETPITLPSVQNSFNYMYQDCTSLTSIATMDANISGSYVGMYQGCTGLVTVNNLSDLTSERGKIRDFTDFFKDCTGLVSVNANSENGISGTDALCLRMFSGCTSLSSVILNITFSTNDLGYNPTCEEMFKSCAAAKQVEGETIYTGLTTVGGIISGTLPREALENMFSSCSLLETGPTLNITTNENSISACNSTFRSCIKLTTVNGSISGTFAPSGFYEMFEACARLTTAPTLNLSGTPYNYCCNRMFCGCGTQAIVEDETVYGGLSAVNGTITIGSFYVGIYSYERSFMEMFKGCYNLQSLPTFTCTTDKAGSYCFTAMFYRCYSLESVPQSLLSSYLTLADTCYHQMFYECKSINALPTLPATTLASSCYGCMFDGCTSIEETLSSGALPATTPATNCYSRMFRNTSITGMADGAMALTTLTTSCCYSMFENCANLASVYCIATNPSTSYTNNWLSGAGTDVQGEKTFTQKTGVTWPSGVSGIPEGWTAEYVNA